MTRAGGFSRPSPTAIRAPGMPRTAAPSILFSKIHTSAAFSRMRIQFMETRLRAARITSPDIQPDILSGYRIRFAFTNFILLLA
jgi:hypothetical protein